MGAGHAVVTGGASGIGRAVVDRLLARGAAVSVLDVQRYTDGPSVRSFEVDVTDESAVNEAMAAAAAALGPPDRLVACAGIRGQRALALDLDTAAWRRLLDVHLFGTWWACRAFANLVLGARGIAAPDRPADDRGEASVVTVSSIVAAGAFSGRLDYGTAKAAITYLTKVLAVEWAPLGIRVNAVSPGYTRTPMVDSMVAEGYDLAPAEERTPMGRLAEPDEMASAVEFLLYDASYVTGAVLAVDGGWTAVGR